VVQACTRRAEIPAGTGQVRYGIDMACSIERPRWVAGLLKPVNAVLWVSGIAVTLVGAIVSDGVAGLLPFIGSALFFIGTSGGALSVSAIGSWTQLVSGAGTREAAIRGHIRDLKHRLQEVARPLCQRKSEIKHAIAEASLIVARKWPGKPDQRFEFYLLCCTVAEAVKLMHRERPVSVEQHRKVAGALRDFGIPPTAIAPMLDLSPEDIRQLLRPEASQP